MPTVTQRDATSSPNETDDLYLESTALGEPAPAGGKQQGRSPCLCTWYDYAGFMVRRIVAAALIVLGAFLAYVGLQMLIPLAALLMGALLCWLGVRLWR
jgi:hypothetical protein